MGRKGIDYRILLRRKKMRNSKKPKKPVRSAILTGFELKIALAHGIFKEILTPFLKKIKGFAGKDEAQRAGVK